MTEEELKTKIIRLETKIEELEKRLKENQENDEKRHREYLEQHRKQHGEKMRWNKLGGVGGILTAIAGTIGAIAWIIKMFKGDEPRNKSDIDKYY